MKCYVCGETLRGSYFTYKNQPICEKDYKVKCQEDFRLKCSPDYN
jgi:hypothetical protein